MVEAIRNPKKFTWQKNERKPKRLILNKSISSDSQKSEKHISEFLISPRELKAILRNASEETPIYLNCPNETDGGEKVIEFDEAAFERHLKSEDNVLVRIKRNTSTKSDSSSGGASSDNSERQRKLWDALKASRVNVIVRGDIVTIEEISNESGSGSANSDG